MADNKETILNIATMLFSKRGYEGVGVQEICEAASITKPTLYYYFKSKQGILETLVQTKGEELYQLISENLAYKHDFINSLTKVLQAELVFAAKNPDFFRCHLVLVNAPEGSEERNIYNSLIKNIDDCFLNFFRNSCNEFGNMAGKESLYAELFHQNVIAVIKLCLDKKLIVTDQTIYQIIHSFIYGVAN